MLLRHPAHSISRGRRSPRAIGSPHRRARARQADLARGRGGASRRARHGGGRLRRHRAARPPHAAGHRRAARRPPRPAARRAPRRLRGADRARGLLQPSPGLSGNALDRGRDLPRDGRRSRLLAGSGRLRPDRARARPRRQLRPAGRGGREAAGLPAPARRRDHRPERVLAGGAARRAGVRGADGRGRPARG